MATQMFLSAQLMTIRISTRGRNDAKADGSTSGWDLAWLSTTRGAGVASAAATTVAGPTNGLEVGNVRPFEWLSEPLAADATISGTITFNIRCLESSMSANAGPQVIIERVDSTGAIVSTVVNSENGTEAGTSEGAKNWTATPTSTDFQKGDRIRVRVLANDVGTMGAGFTFTVVYNGTSAGGSGDTYVTFTENLTFQSTEPAGTTAFLRATASDIADQGRDERAIATTAGAGASTATTNTVAGWTAPVQITTSAGGSLIEWYTERLAAFTLSGPVFWHLWASESNAAAEVRYGVEIAVVANDGTNVRVYGYGLSNTEPTSPSRGGLNAYVAGDDIAVADGERIRVRAYIDDGALAQVSGHTTTLGFDASGTLTISATNTDVSGVIFTETLSAYVPPAASPRHGFVNYQDPGVL